MSEYAEAFTLGNAAILGNVCLLPLYPGLVVMMSARLANPRSRLSTMSLGVVVLAGIVTFMVVLGFVLYQISRPVADVLDWLLPLMYGTVFVLGAAMFLGRSPFARLIRTDAPVLRSPAATAYLYGVFLAPMTLPCTGPIVVSAFVIGSVSGSAALADSLAYFMFYALGFGWPLVVLPMLAAPAQGQITRFLAVHHRVIEVSVGQPADRHRHLRLLDRGPSVDVTWGVVAARQSSGLVVGEDDVPPVEAVLAAIRHDVTLLPRLDLGVLLVPPRAGEQVGAATAIDARDDRVGLEHHLHCARSNLPRCVSWPGNSVGVA